jgi:2-dehydropantoate 2-reductase
VDTEAVAQDLSRVLPPDTLVVSLQNGVDNAWRMSAHLPNPVVPAAVYVSAEMPGDGRLRHNGGGSIVAGHPLRGGVADVAAGSALDALVAHFVAAGVPCRVSDDIRVICGPSSRPTAPTTPSRRCRSCAIATLRQ